MKKPTFFLALTALCFTNSFAQGLNTELGYNRSYDQRSNAMLVIGDDTYLVEHGRIADYFNLSYLHKLDTTGIEDWELVVFPDIGQSLEVVDINALIPAADGGLYLTAYGSGQCDVVSEDFTFIAKVASDGTQLEWMTYVNQISVGQQVAPEGLYEYAPNQLVICALVNGEYKVQTYNSVGDLLSTTNVGTTKLERIRKLSQFEWVGSNDNYLYGINAIGATTDVSYFSTPITGIETNDDYLLVMTNDSLFVHDEFLNRLTGFDIPGYSNFSNLKRVSDGWNLLAKSATGIHRLKLDDLYQLTDQLFISTGDFSDALIDYSESHLSMAESFNLTEREAIRYRDFSLVDQSNEAFPSTDIGIIDARTEQIWVDTFMMGSTPIYTWNLDISVCVKNFGTNALNSCRINRDIGMYFCGGYFYSQKFEGLDVNPGDTTWLHLGWTGNTSGNYATYPFNVNVCFYSSHANQLTDLNVPNDELCRSFTINTLATNELTENTVSFYPNPTNGVVRVSLPGTDLPYELLTVSGELVRKGETINKEMDLTGLPAGIYLVKIIPADGNPFIGRVILG